jgi:hypothetical protein
MALKSYLRSGRDYRRIPGLFSWYDFSDSAAVTLDSGRVAGLRNKAQDNWHLANTSSGSTQPTYALGGRNGLNVGSFSAASNQRLQVPSSNSAFKFLHDGTPCWFIIAGSYGASSNPNALYIQFATNAGGSGAGIYYSFEDSAANGGNNGIDMSVGAEPGFACGAYYGSSGYPASVKNIVTPQTPTIQEMSLDVGNATPANRAKLKINGGSEITFNEYSATPNSGVSQTNFTLGSLSNGGYALQGELYELLIFNQKPTAAACDYVRRTMGAYWGITVA